MRTYPYRSSCIVMTYLSRYLRMFPEKVQIIHQGVKMKKD